MGQRLDRKKLLGLKNCLEGLVKKKKHKGMVKVPNGHMFGFIEENRWICVSMTKEELE